MLGFPEKRDRVHTEITPQTKQECGFEVYGELSRWNVITGRRPMRIITRNRGCLMRSSLDNLKGYDSPSRMKQTASGPQAIQPGAWRRRPAEASRSIPSVTPVGLAPLERKRTASPRY